MAGATTPGEGAALVYGLGVTGRAVARALVRHGRAVVVGDDRDTPEAQALADEVGTRLHVAPTGADLDALVASSTELVPAPGLPEAHPVVVAALRAGRPVRSELDLAQAWESASARPRPFLAVTGTDGKTTVTTMVTAMVAAGGRRAEAVGNTDVPLVDALDGDAEVFVVEASSFRLRFAGAFHPRVATWLNLAEDHLDWHPSMEAYAEAKAAVWAHQGPADVAVGAADDPVVAAHLERAAARRVTFGLDRGDYRVAGAELVGPSGAILAVDALPRALPHDLRNALAASATALEAGVALDAVRRALVSYRHLPHRVALVAEHAGVRWYDDSKATTPHAAVAAVTGFDSVVLIAGGRNKGLDLAPLRAGLGHLRAVVAIGESADAVAAVFGSDVEVLRAGDMDAAVAAAASRARPGDVVLLSPACASFDWYRSYGQRGDDFARAARALVPTPPGGPS